jgi:pilus assembly protein Flp/PilA
MCKEHTMLRKFLNDESGATAIEYGLIAALVAVAIIVALTAMGSSLSDLFTGVKGKLDTVKPK